MQYPTSAPRLFRFGLATGSVVNSRAGPDDEMGIEATVRAGAGGLAEVRVSLQVPRAGVTLPARRQRRRI